MSCHSEAYCTVQCQRVAWGRWHSRACASLNFRRRLGPLAASLDTPVTAIVLERTADGVARMTDGAEIAESNAAVGAGLVEPELRSIDPLPAAPSGGGAVFGRDAVYALAVRQRHAAVDDILRSAGPTDARDAERQMAVFMDALAGHHLDTLDVNNAPPTAVAVLREDIRSSIVRFQSTLAHADRTHEALLGYLRDGQRHLEVSHALARTDADAVRLLGDEEDVVAELLATVVLSTASSAAREAVASAEGKRSRPSTPGGEQRQRRRTGRLDAERQATVTLLEAAVRGLTSTLMDGEEARLLAKFGARIVDKARAAVLQLTTDALAALLGALLSALVLVGTYRLAASAATYLGHSELDTARVREQLDRARAGAGDAAELVDTLETLVSAEGATLRDEVQAAYMVDGGDVHAAAAAVERMYVAPSVHETPASDAASIELFDQLSAELNQVVRRASATLEPEQQQRCARAWYDYDGMERIARQVIAASAAQRLERARLQRKTSEVFAGLRAAVRNVFESEQAALEQLEQLDRGAEGVRELRRQAPVYMAVTEFVLGRLKAPWLLAVLNNVFMSHVLNAESTLNAVLAAAGSGLSVVGVVGRSAAVGASLVAALSTNAWTVSLLGYAARGSAFLVRSAVAPLARWTSSYVARAGGDDAAVTLRAVDALLNRTVGVLDTMSAGVRLGETLVSVSSFAGATIAAAAGSTALFAGAAIVVHAAATRSSPVKSAVRVCGVLYGAYDYSYAVARWIGAFAVAHPLLVTGGLGAVVVAVYTMRGSRALQRLYGVSSPSAVTNNVTQALADLMALSERSGVPTCALSPLASTAFQFT